MLTLNRRGCLWAILIAGIAALIAVVSAACVPVSPNGSSTGTEGNGRKDEQMLSSLIDQAATMTFEEYNPKSIIEAVNALQPLAKEAALEQVESYLQNRDNQGDNTGLFWVLRTLFEVPADPGFPPVRIGQPSIPAPAEAGSLPRFPIVLVRDIPFLAVRGYTLGGLPESVETHVAYFREHGVLRVAPLAPGALDGIEDEFLRQWRAAYGDQHTAEALATIREQVARLGE